MSDASQSGGGPLDPEDEKLVVLARSARARNQAVAGAAVRDETGRTYAATTVQLPSLELSAVQAAVAMAVSGGAEALEAAVVVGDEDQAAAADVAAVGDLRADRLLMAAPDGSVHGTVRLER
ncbi:cytidine deaminase [Lipingzhangella sp. LS1_29]|uniref:Cytidine deaminase n=1 Tax=Lipingzhangella rawalii TaxID=2055835 RepID=A0ABU2H7C3_9ACTN|nr:cytidine deaminase [Lipingzhangella rawalii]MDS1271188.1 cytidine deaminase [Lipingzhangella rawalii]